jgi:hypothetical protein
MKKLLLTTIAALFLATGAAQANSNWTFLCGGMTVYVLGHHGYEYATEDERILPPQKFKWRWANSGPILYYRGRKCTCLDGFAGGEEQCVPPR